MDNIMLLKIKEDKRFTESDYYRDISDKGLIYQIHRPTKLKRIVDTHIPTVFLGIGWQHRMINATTAYRPDNNKITFEDQNGGIVVNNYNPPDHFIDGFWGLNNLITPKECDKLPFQVDNIPKPYGDFFTHLFNNDLASIEYFIYWLVKALDVKNGRNLTTLVLISTPGVGKGVLFSHVIEPLFGSTNTALISGANAFVNQFNSQFADKQVVMIDEANLTDTESLDRFKTLVNNSLEVEKKGKDKFTTQNWLNILIASNNLDSIRIEEGDRRFSVVTMARNKMLGDVYADVRALTEELSANDNILKLFTFLMSVKVEHDMNRPFKSTQTEAIKDASLKDWERGILEYITDKWDDKYPVNLFTVKHLQEEITKTGNLKSPPGWTRFKSLCDRFPEYLEFRQLVISKINNKKQERCVILKKPYITSSFDNTKPITEDELALTSSKFALTTKGLTPVLDIKDKLGVKV